MTFGLSVWTRRKWSASLERSADRVVISPSW